jgi:hypothetical protein
MGQASESRITELVEAIRCYLSQHADAADDEHGIAAWWLRSMGMQAARDEVEEALDRLHAMGIIARRRLPDGRTIYHACCDGERRC